MSFNIHSLSRFFVDVDESTISPGQQGDAEYFAQMFSGVLRYNVESKKWLIWNGQYWDEDPGEGIVEFGCYMNNARLAKAKAALRTKKQVADPDADDELIANKRFEEEAKYASKHYKHLIGARHHNYINGFIKLAQSFPVLKTTMKEWDKDPFLLATPEGVIELETGKCRPGKQSDMISRGIPIKYDEKATCPRFEKFIEEILEFPSEIPIMQNFLGYCLTGAVQSQVIGFFLGEGSNGKSKLLDTLSEMLGQDSSGFAWTMSMSSLSDKARDNIPADVAALVGKRVAIAAEAGEGRAIDVVKLKQLSGEETLNARRLYGNPINFRARMKVILNVNHLPLAKDSSNGYWRRCLIWIFPRNFEAEGAGKDPLIMDKLRAEYPGILNWMVAGAVRWKKEGLNHTERQKELTQEYRNDNDPLLPFVNENLIFGEKDVKITISRLRALASEWNKSADKKFTDDALAKRLTKSGAERRQYGKERVWYWFGVMERGALPDMDAILDPAIKANI